MLWTLAMHAHDAASARPILGDRFAADLLDRVDEPPDLGVSLGGNTPLICTRAKLIDDAARAFLARHDEAVVLHLGCGLDSRVLRLDPRPSVRWFDVDQEPVIELRRQLYDDREGATTIAASVTDPGWWSQLPDDLPRLVLAEGLLMYLAPDGVRTVVTHALSSDATPPTRWLRGSPGSRAGSRRCGRPTPTSSPPPRIWRQRPRRPGKAMRSPWSTPRRPGPAGFSRRPSVSSRWPPEAATQWC